MRCYKTACTKPIPPDAKIVIRKGVKCARYKVKGNWMEYPLTESGKVRIESKYWSLDFKDRKDKPRHLQAYTNKVESQILGKNIEEYLICNVSTKNGLTKQDWIAGLYVKVRNKLIEFDMLETESEANKSLDELVDEFEVWMHKTRVPRHGFLRDPHHVQVTMSNLRRIVRDCGFKWWSDIKPYKVEQYMGSKGWSKRTFNSYLMAIKQFCNWMVDNDRANKSPVKKIKRLVLDEESYRRVLTTEEFTRFLDATANAPYRYGMTGLERAIVYLLATETGLRLNELRSLTVSSFDFDDCAVIVEKISSKNRKGARQYLKQERIEPLKDFLQDKLPLTKAFNMPNQLRGSNMIRADLKETKVTDCDGKVIQEAIPFETKDGRFDFHSLRYIFSTAINKTDATWLEHKVLMRHSTKGDLTARYTSISSGRLREIIEHLPKYQWPLTEDMRLKTVG